MGTLPVITDVYRITANFNKFDGVEPHNVHHVFGALTNEHDLGTLIDSAFLNACIHVMPNSYHILSWTVLKLDGSSAGVVVPSTSGFAGSGSGEGVPSAAAVVSLRTGARGARGRGRQFIGPACEDQIANGMLDPTTAATMSAGWGDYADNLQAASPLAALVVASYKHADANPVAFNTVQAVLGTQRRRQDQLR